MSFTSFLAAVSKSRGRRPELRICREAAAGLQAKAAHQRRRQYDGRGRHALSDQDTDNLAHYIATLN